VTADPPPSDSEFAVHRNELEGRSSVRTAKTPRQLKDLGLPLNGLNSELRRPIRNARLLLLAEDSRLMLFVCRIDLANRRFDEGSLV
jgi:hypothetical protein